MIPAIRKPDVIKDDAAQSVREAAEWLLSNWPAEGRGPAYAGALQACLDALAVKLSTDKARLAFIAAAREADIFVRAAGRRG
jgi:Protein of unknown function (DUF982)